MSVISLVNLKGGVAKTVSTINLAAAMAKEGKRILIIDTDSQGNIAAAMGMQPDALQYSLAHLMSKAITGEVSKQEIADCIVPRDGVDILPSNSLLATLDPALMNAMCRESILKSISDQMRDQYDYIFIDCPPSLGVIVKNALVASDFTLIPVEAHYLCFESLRNMVDTIRLVKLKLNPGLEIAGIFLTMYQSRTNLSKEIRKLIKDTYGGSIRVFDDCIPYSIKAAEQTLHGKSIIDLEPNHPVAQGYIHIAKELMANDGERSACTEGRTDGKHSIR